MQIYFRFLAIESMAKISIIIPTNRFDKSFDVCLKQLAEIQKKDSFELVIALDGLETTEKDFIPYKINKLKLVKIEQQSGPAVARNLAAKMAESEILFFIDSDVLIQSTTIQLIAKHYTKSTAEEALIGSYDDMPAEQSLVSKYRNLLHHYTHQTASEKASTFWGACGAIKKEVFMEIGGFNENYHQPSIEDIELGYRLLENGYSIRLNKNLQVKHLKKWTIRNMIYTDIFLRAKPWTILLNSFKQWKTRDLNTKTEEKLAATLLVLALLSLVFSLFLSQLIGLVFAFCLVLIFLKRNVYSFFKDKVKFYQMPLVVLLHWLYLLCAVIGFILGTFAPKKSQKFA